MIKIFVQISNVDFAKVSALSIHFFLWLKKWKLLAITKILRDYSHRFLESFDWICLDLLIAKLNAYGFDRNALKLFYDCFRKRSQNAKLSFSFSVCLDIIYGLMQGSILGPQLFNLDIYGLFFEGCGSGFADFADDINL